ncbi:hypothetical protein CGSMWGv1500E_04206 [Gardnerella vaginalis 1500E]|uniref:Uncharacterized protein n=1 Tax=Gardnerella vaginalis 1500E TaxID=698957 RepID=I4LZJ0_GARVA|nr:hypothetical protein CGSMWGv1500E_04206 [Gardnerella vaginalis 1500E]
MLEEVELEEDSEELESESESAKLKTELEAEELEAAQLEVALDTVALEVALSAPSHSLILCQAKARDARRPTRDANPRNFAGNIFSPS